MWDIENILLTLEPDFLETVGVLNTGKFLKGNKSYSEASSTGISRHRIALGKRNPSAAQSIHHVNTYALYGKSSRCFSMAQKVLKKTINRKKAFPHTEELENGSHIHIHTALTEKAPFAAWIARNNEGIGAATEKLGLCSVEGYFPNLCMVLSVLCIVLYVLWKGSF